MKKKLIALFAACSMITTAVAGLVQTAYADGANVRIEVSDGTSDTEKVLTFYYEGVDGVNTIEGTLTFTGGDVTINSGTITIANDMGEVVPDEGYVGFTSFDGTSSVDGSFATVTVTVPGDADITVAYALEGFEDIDFETYEDEIGTVYATIPANSSDPVPAAVSAVQKQDSVNGEGIYAEQTADVYAVELAANDDVVTGVDVVFDPDHKGTLMFDTEITGGSVVFAVILANVSGVASLPSLDDATITAILK
jgi:hypothetical protein